MDRLPLPAANAGTDPGAKRPMPGPADVVLGPAARLTDTDTRRKSRLLAVAVLVMLLIFGVSDAHAAVADPTYRVPWFGYLFLVGTFVVNRAGFFALASWLILVMFPSVIFGSLLTGYAGFDVHSTTFLLLGIMLASLLRRDRETVVFASLNLLGMLALHWLLPAGRGHWAALSTPLLVVSVGTVLTLTITHYRNLLEHDRQAELRASRERYRQLVESTDDWVWETDAADRYTYASPQVTQLLGYAPDEILGKTPFDLMPPDEAARIRALFAAASPKHEAIRGLLTRNRHRTGREVLLETNGLPILDAHGRLLGYCGIDRDVTEREQAAADRQRLEERLRHAEKMEAIGQLAGGVAHDFNNQLSAILGFAELLRSQLPAHDPLHVYAGMIEQAGRRSAELTGKLLAFARKGKYRVEAVDLHQMIRELVALLERSLDKRVQIQLALAAEPALTMGDATQLQNALLNLAINAGDAMPQGGTLTFATARLTLDAAQCRDRLRDLEPGPYLEIRVSDTGVGMAEETQRHLFEPFFTTKREGKGTGLGLAAVYGTVKNHKGAVSVDSEWGKGSTFRLYLPAADPAARPLTAAPPAAAAATGTGRILLVDDEDVVRHLGRAMLTGMGYDVIACQDGFEAVNYYREHWTTIAAVVLDMSMPRMSGREAFLAMQTVNPNVKAIILSAYGVEAEIQAVLDAGAAGFIRKPFRSAELAQELAAVLAPKPKTT